MTINPLQTLKIENVVASAKINDAVDLVSLAAQIPGADYDKKRFPGVVIRIENPKIAALVFGSGKVVLTGAKSLDDLDKGLQYLLDLLKKLKIDIEGKPKCNVQNIVTSADLGSRINLNKIAMGLTLDKIEYEPEQFPGLVYRLDDPKVVVLLFGSGKVIITGGRSNDDAGKAVAKICNDLQSLKIL